MTDGFTPGNRDNRRGMEQPPPPRFPALVVKVPDWVETAVPGPDHVYKTVEERMGLAIRLSRLNIGNNTGGPFGAAVFDIGTAKLVSAGVNLVVPSRWSGGHSEMVACAVAQQLLKTHDLGGPGLPALELVTSTEPCAMCFGAIPWTGVCRLACGASDEDARRIGFDEGPRPADWVRQLEIRGIEVRLGVLREEARQVLDDYASRKGIIYNGRAGRRPG